MFCWAWAQVKLGSAFSSYHPLHVQVAYDQMTGGSEDELWEGENLVYRCKNDTLVLNDDPDMVKVQWNNNMRMILIHLYSYKDGHVILIFMHYIRSISFTITEKAHTRPFS